MVKRHGNESTDKLEIMQVIWVDKRGWIDLETIVVLVGIFKQTVHRIQHLMRQKEKPFSEKLRNFLVKKDMCDAC